MFLTEKHNQGTGHTPKDVYTYTDGSGTTQTATVTYYPVTSGTNIGCSGIAEEAVEQVYVPTLVDIEPVGAIYNISWVDTNADGHLFSVTYPNGSSVGYAYSGGNGNGSGETCAGVIGTLAVTTSPDSIAKHTITYVNNRTATNQLNFTVTATNDTDNSKYVHSYASAVDVNEPFSNWPYPYDSGQFLTESQTYQGTTLLARHHN